MSPSTPPDTPYIWNFAFGSNLHPEKRNQRAICSEIEAIPAVVRGWRLAFNLPGVFYIEPAMAGLIRAPGLDAHGVLLRLTPDAFDRLAKIEGEGLFYRRTLVETETYDNRRIQAYIFTTAPEMEGPERQPSQRYLELIREGALLSDLAPEYCAFLQGLPHAPSSMFQGVCSRLFIRTITVASQSQFQAWTMRYLVLMNRLLCRPQTRAMKLVQTSLIAPAVLLGLCLYLRGETCPGQPRRVPKCRRPV